MRYLQSLSVRSSSLRLLTNAFQRSKIGTAITITSFKSSIFLSLGSNLCDDGEGLRSISSDRPRQLGWLVAHLFRWSDGVNIWLLRGYIDTIPLELDEAARIDGASTFQIYWLIFFPLAAPVLAVTALLSFIGTFNEFVLASLFLTDIHHRTVAVGLQSFVGAQFGQN
jgi:hypothetical protein